MTQRAMELQALRDSLSQVDGEIRLTAATSGKQNVTQFED
jgi:hypothetical protein